MQCFITQLRATALTQTTLDQHLVITAAPSVIGKQRFPQGISFSVMNSLSSPKICLKVVITSTSMQHNYSFTTASKSKSGILFPTSVDLPDCSP